MTGDAEGVYIESVLSTQCAEGTDSLLRSVMVNGGKSFLFDGGSSVTGCPALAEK